MFPAERLYAQPPQKSPNLQVTTNSSTWVPKTSGLVAPPSDQIRQPASTFSYYVSQHVDPCRLTRGGTTFILLFLVLVENSALGTQCCHGVALADKFCHKHVRIRDNLHFQMIKQCYVRS